MAYLGGMVRWVPAPHSRDPPFPGPGIGVRVRVKVRVRVRVRRTPGMADPGNGGSREWRTGIGAMLPSAGTMNFLRML